MLFLNFSVSEFSSNLARQRIFPACQRSLHLSKDKAEHFLVPPAIHQAVQSPSNDVAGSGSTKDPRHHPRHNPPSPAILDRALASM